MAEPGSPAEVLRVGGGVAALETLMALRDLAGDRVRVTLVAREPDFV
jgi:NADH dehydrogenase FAD-containing subunit